MRHSPGGAAVLALLIAPSLAYAVMDIRDQGPTLKAGNFAMRVTNVGVIGNAFFDVGLSNDPSFEFPIDSGQELLGHAELWVGAIDREGQMRVSGGPALEWRPTLAEDDRVREAWHGRLGSGRRIDDDADGRIDEESHAPGTASSRSAGGISRAASGPGSG